MRLAVVVLIALAIATASALLGFYGLAVADISENPSILFETISFFSSVATSLALQTVFVFGPSIIIFVSVSLFGLLHTALTFTSYHISRVVLAVTGWICVQLHLALVPAVLSMAVTWRQGVGSLDAYLLFAHQACWFAVFRVCLPTLGPVVAVLTGISWRRLRLQVAAALVPVTSLGSRTVWIPTATTSAHLARKLQGSRHSIPAQAARRLLDASPTPQSTTGLFGSFFQRFLQSAGWMLNNVNLVDLVQRITLYASMLLFAIAVIYVLIAIRMRSQYRVSVTRTTPWLRLTSALGPFQAMLDYYKSTQLKKQLQLLNIVSVLVRELGRRPLTSSWQRDKELAEMKRNRKLMKAKIAKLESELAELNKEKEIVERNRQEDLKEVRPAPAHPNLDI